MRLIFILLSILIAPSLASAALTIEQKKADLYELNAIIAADYGPLRFKQERFGIDLESLTRLYERKIAYTETDDEFSRLLVQFIAEFKDSHFSGKISSPEKLHLGFTTELVQGKILVEDINRSELSLESFPFAKGDEIVSFDGAPIQETISKLQSYIGMGNEETARKLAVYLFPQNRVNPAKDHVIVGVKKRGTEFITEVMLPWKRKTATIDLLKEKIEAKAPVGMADWCSEKSRIVPPPGASIVTDVPFTAFTFSTAKGTVGFLRIPHYYPVDKSTGQEVAALRFSQYEKVIQKFEAETVGLIIDQDYNCGGSILFVNKMLSLFLREPFTPAEFEFRASETQIEGLSRHLKKFTPSTEGYKQFSHIIDEIQKAKNAGLYSTQKLPVHGVMEVKLDLPGEDWVEPNPIGYTKPIVLLINEMSGSGGDLFPAMMKDLGRARLFGNHTMGAGGHAWDDPHIELKNSKLTVNLTRSLIYRPNGQPIENAGITPHAAYEITMDDFMGGYQTYLHSAKGELMGLLP